ncbi:hypothetical protein DL93DRAFT_1569262 [Clavulina sp. PMI_390]|nr:hypothetical protein DL93DRAFT_1569262 [Clavulina sp. PMI_390]
MAVGNRGAPKSTGAPRTGTVPPAPSLTPAADPTANGKRKKKKKGKSRAESYDDDEDEDVPPPLEHNAYANATAPNATTTNTGLSPQLEATHLATGHMNGPQGTGATIGIGVGIASSDRVRATQEELEATASELFNQFLESPATFGGVNVGVGMGGVPLTQLSGIPMPMGPGSGGADDYWNNLPTQTRDFAQTMYSMAQHVIQTGRVPTSKALPGSYPVSSIPFDPSVLSDPAIKLSLEAAFNSVAANGGFPPISLGAFNGQTHIPQQSSRSPIHYSNSSLFRRIFVLQTRDIMRRTTIRKRMERIS